MMEKVCLVLRKLVPVQVSGTQSAFDQKVFQSKAKPTKILTFESKICFAFVYASVSVVTNKKYSEKTMEECFSYSCYTERQSV